MKKINFKIIFNLTLLLLLICTSNTQPKPITLKSHLSSGWYPQDKEKLEKTLDNYFQIAQKKFKVLSNPQTIKALIAPHAGVYYSGICAATAYQTLLNKGKKNTKIKKVIILAPTHTKAFEGIAIPSFDSYQTAFGKIEVAKNSIEKLKTNKIFKIVTDVFEKEHAIEIQLPFLQKTINKFELIPLIIGNIKDDEYDSITNRLEKTVDDSTLIVISTDFMHYGPNFRYTPFQKYLANMIRFVDSETIKSITMQSSEMLNTIIKNTGTTICGINCIKILLNLLQTKPLQNLESHLTCYYSSNHLKQAISNNQIVIQKLIQNFPDEKSLSNISYAGLIFTTEKLQNLKPENQLTQFEKKSLLYLAYRSISNEFEKEKIPSHLLWPIRTFGLEQKKGAFVTINTKDGNLRGCVGIIQPIQELFKTVQQMAIAAAFKDTRFKPISKDELKDIVIDITVLTPPKKIKHYNEIELGKHGIILEKTKNKRLHSAVFLPQVPLLFALEFTNNFTTTKFKSRS